MFINLRCVISKMILTHQRRNGFHSGKTLAAYNPETKKYEQHDFVNCASDVDVVSSFADVNAIHNPRELQRGLVHIKSLFPKLTRSSETLYLRSFTAMMAIKLSSWTLQQKQHHLVELQRQINLINGANILNHADVVDITVKWVKELSPNDLVSLVEVYARYYVGHKKSTNDNGNQTSKHVEIQYLLKAMIHRTIELVETFDVLKLRAMFVLFVRFNCGGQLLSNDKVRTHLVRSCSKYSADDISSILYSYAKSRRTTMRPAWNVFKAFENEICKKIESFETNHLVEMSFALSTYELCTTPAFSAIYKRIFDVSHLLNGFQLSTVVLSYAGKNSLSALSSSSTISPSSSTTYSLARFFSLLARRTHELAFTLSPTEISTIVLSITPIGKLICDSTSILKCLEMPIVQNTSIFLPHEISNIVWGYARLRLYDSPVFEKFQIPIIRLGTTTTTKMTSRCLATIVWSYATAGSRQQVVVPPPSSDSDTHNTNTTETVVAQSKGAENFPMISTDDTPTMSSTTKKNIYNRVPFLSVFLALETCVGQLSTEFNPLELSNVVWSYATVGLHNSVIFDMLAKPIEKEISGVTRFTPQGISNCIWAYGVGGSGNYEYDRLIKLLAAEVMRLGPILNMQELSNIVSSHAKANLKDAALFNFLAPLVVQQHTLVDIRRHSKNFTNGSSTRDRHYYEYVPVILWSYATCGYKSGDTDICLFNSLENYIECEVGNFIPQHLVMILWSYATVGKCEQSSIFHCISQRIESQIKLNNIAFTTQGLCNIVWAYASVGHHTSGVFPCLDGTIIEQLNFMKPSDVGNIAWAYATVGYQTTSSSLFDAIESYINNNISRFAKEEQGMVNILWSLALLQRHNSLHRVLSRFQPFLMQSSLWNYNSNNMESSNRSHRNQLAQALLEVKVFEATREGVSSPTSTSDDTFGIIDDNNVTLTLPLCSSETDSSMLSLGGKAQQQFRINDYTPHSMSEMQYDITLALRRCFPHLAFHSEFATQVGYTVDIKVGDDKQWIDTTNSTNKIGYLGIEVDGPKHFYTNSHTATAKCLMKRRHMASLGWHIISIPHWQWVSMNVLKYGGALTIEQRKYLESLLEKFVCISSK